MVGDCGGWGAGVDVPGEGQAEGAVTVTWLSVWQLPPWSSVFLINFLFPLGAIGVGRPPWGVSLSCGCV